MHLGEYFAPLFGLEASQAECAMALGLPYGLVHAEAQLAQSLVAEGACVYQLHSGEWKPCFQVEGQ